SFLSSAAPGLWKSAGIVALGAAGTWPAGRALPPDAQMHRLALALAWGTVAGSVLQIAVQLPACWALLQGGGLALRFTTRAEGVRDVLVAWGPLVLGAGVAQISGLVDTFLGSFTGAGGISSLGYAQLLQVLPISLFGVSVAAVTLPELSREAAAGTPNELLRARLAAGLRRGFYFVVPSSFAVVAPGPVIGGPLFAG